MIAYLLTATLLTSPVALAEDPPEAKAAEVKQAVVGENMRLKAQKPHTNSNQSESPMPF